MLVFRCLDALNLVGNHTIPKHLGAHFAFRIFVFQLDLEPTRFQAELRLMFTNPGPVPLIGQKRRALIPQPCQLKPDSPPVPFGRKLQDGAIYCFRRPPGGRSPPPQPVSAVRVPAPPSLRVQKTPA